MVAVSVSSVGKVIVICRRAGVGALTVKVFVSTIFKREDESNTSWLLGVYATFRLTGCIVTVAAPFSM